MKDGKDCKEGDSVLLISSTVDLTVFHPINLTAAIIHIFVMAPRDQYISGKVPEVPDAGSPDMRSDKEHYLSPPRPSIVAGRGTLRYHSDELGGTFELSVPGM